MNRPSLRTANPHPAGFWKYRLFSQVVERTKSFVNTLNRLNSVNTCVLRCLRTRSRADKPPFAAHGEPASCGFKSRLLFFQVVGRTKSFVNTLNRLNSVNTCVLRCLRTRSRADKPPFAAHGEPASCGFLEIQIIFSGCRKNQVLCKHPDQLVLPRCGGAGCIWRCGQFWMLNLS